MAAYLLYVTDENGQKSVTWSHTDDGLPCLHFPDDQPVTIVLEHKSCTTFIDLDENGEFTIEQA